MFINFRILLKGHKTEIVELQTTTPKEALSLMSFFEDSHHVVAWQIPNNDPSDFGAAIGSSSIWKKYRPAIFTKDDYITAGH